MKSWICFHCDESFTDRASAAQHFGPSEHSTPICQINAAEYRAMEKRMVNYNEEDSALHRTMYGMQAKHAVDLQREEEKGYARGVADAHRDMVEPVAEMIYKQWAARPGYVRWVPGGNALIQDDARALARYALGIL